MDESSPLLRLSPGVRRRIYRFVGLASWDRLEPHQIDLHRRRRPTNAVKPSSFHGLLLSCRLIYAEAAALIYLSSQFVLHYVHNHGHPEPLAPLQALTTTSLASLTSLTIVLNQTSCFHHSGHYGSYIFCCLGGYHTGRDSSGLDYCQKDHPDAHHLPLLAGAPTSSALNNNPEGNQDDTSVAAAQHLLAQWHLAAARLSCIASGRLALGLVCDIDPHHERALDIAMLATTPLQSIPRLRDCHIRLCHTPDPRLQQVAEASVLQACRIPSPPYSKPPTQAATLITLPYELRLRILEYTDLITPSREVQWSRQDQGYVAFFGDSDHAPHREYRDQFYACRTSSDPNFSIGCFCRRRHTAFSFQCKCWAPPTPLFLVCRTLYRDAQLTFFSGNHFIVHDYEADPCWILPFLGQNPEPGPAPRYDYHSERFGASQFLREVVPAHCLAYLRFIELVFPPYLSQSWPQAGQPAMQDWWATVDWLQDKINAPSLTIRLVGAKPGPGAPDVYTDTINDSDAHTIMKSYQELLRSLKPLADNGLARFYADLPYPWMLAGEPQNRFARWDWVSAQEKKLKERAERFVMGGRYEEQYANGREEPTRSFWTWFHYEQI
jgi:hypothetical protein